MGCQFTIAWVGKCEKDVVEGEEYCIDHLNVKCCSCGEQATHTCHETMGAFVCRANLCDDCEHRIASDGTNGGASRHVKKDEQEHEPWYERSKNNEQNNNED